MNVTTLPADRPRRTQQGASRSGGRTTGATAERASGDAPTIGATALQPERGTTQPEHGRRTGDRRAAGERDGQRPGCGWHRRHRSARPRRRSWRWCWCWSLGVIGILVLNTRIAENAFKLDALRTKQGEASTATRSGCAAIWPTRSPR